MLMLAYVVKQMLKFGASVINVDHLMHVCVFLRLVVQAPFCFASIHTFSHFKHTNNKF